MVAVLSCFRGSSQRAMESQVLHFNPAKRGRLEVKVKCENEDGGRVSLKVTGNFLDAANRVSWPKTA